MALKRIFPRTFLLLFAFAAQVTWAAPEASKPPAQVQALKVTILSTMLADTGIGE